MTWTLQCTRQLHDLSGHATARVKRRQDRTDGRQDSRSHLNEVIERAIDWVRKGTGAGFEMHWRRGPPCIVIGSAGQLQQVLMNLLQNAVDAASRPGASHPQLWLTLERDDAQVRLRLRDDGPGILPEDLSRIFEPFFTTKPVGKGTGLGLSISYGIVQEHGGTLNCESTVGKGTRFTLSLPMMPARADVAGRARNRQA